MVSPGYTLEIEGEQYIIMKVIIDSDFNGKILNIMAIDNKLFENLKGENMLEKHKQSLEERLLKLDVQLMEKNLKGGL